MSMDPSQLDRLPKDTADKIIFSQVPGLPPKAQLGAFFGLNLLAMLLLPILALTIIFSKRINRHPVSWVFFLALTFSSFCYCFLIWAGEPTNPHPSDNVRITSAVLAIISPTVEGGTVLALVIKVWSVLVDLVEPRYVKPIAKAISWDPFLLSFTWIITIPILIYAAVIATNDVIWVQRLYFYCTILPQHNDIHVTAMLISMIELALTIIFSVWSAILYFSVSRTIRRKGNSEINADLIFRVMTFTCWIIMTLVVSAIEYRTRTIHVPLAILISTNPIAAFFIFASQRDMLKVWGIGRFARYFNCTQSTEYSGSTDRRSSRAVTNDREMDEVDVDASQRKEFSKLSSVDDFRDTDGAFDGDYEHEHGHGHGYGAYSRDFKDLEAYDLKTDDAYGGVEEDDVQVVHKPVDYGNNTGNGIHLSPVSPTFRNSSGAITASDRSTPAPTSPTSPSSVGSPFSNAFPTPATSVTQHNHKRDSSIPHRKPVPSFASSDMPMPMPSPTPTSPLSPSSSSPAVSRSASGRGTAVGPLQRQQQQQYRTHQRQSSN
ncbi:hypothetical protein E3P99_03830 [Wallemia hederae]|uniref:Uncharacterized protein n=1 Tax=Wallemia hederae TaxID=1540922 RepID=A0A4T0FFB6_9BASI|nr:hypothetical protein E3P99_03830 [Wallemia hederae]